MSVVSSYNIPLERPKSKRKALCRKYPHSSIIILFPQAEIGAFPKDIQEEMF